MTSFMTSFDDRERAFEGLFARDQDLAFRARARRDREIGLWAARRLGLAGDEAEAYAEGVLAAAIRGGEAAVAAKLGEDLGGRGPGLAAEDVRRRMDELLAEAVERLKRP